MRNIMLSTLLTILSLSGVAQDSTLNKKPLEASYLKRSKDQKTVGWVLTFAGAAGFITTLVIDAAQSPASTGQGYMAIFSSGPYETAHKSYTGAYLVSGVCLASGIYLFTAAIKNQKKSKATMLSMGMEKTEILRYGAVYNRSFPAVGIKIGI